MDKISPFQASVLEVPETFNLALLGARGGGKTTAAVTLAFSHLERYTDDASILIVRKTYKSLADFEDELLGMARQITRGEHSYNRQEKILRWRGGKITLLALEREADYFAKVQGGNFSLLIVDEVTAYTSEKLLRLLRSNLRAPEGVATRVVYMGNPGGPLHGRIFERHVKDRKDFIPYTLKFDDDSGEGEDWVTVRSGPADNPFIDQQAYIRRLREACHGDPIRLKQWLRGDWTQGEGLMFPGFDPDLHVLKTPVGRINPDQFNVIVGIDWGISSPSVGLLGAVARRDLQLPNGKSLPRGSVIIEDEVTDCIFGDERMNSSKEWPADRLAERVGNVCANHGVSKPNGVVDDARGLQGETVQGIMRSTGVFWNLAKPKKGRRSEGWAQINSMLQAVTEENFSRPHLYISERCRLLLATLPSAVRDENDPDDWADTPHCPDHAGDALRYLLAESQIKPITFGRTTGLY